RRLHAGHAGRDLEIVGDRLVGELEGVSTVLDVVAGTTHGVDAVGEVRTAERPHGADVPAHPAELDLTAVRLVGVRRVHAAPVGADAERVVARRGPAHPRPRGRVRAAGRAFG